VNAIDLHLGLRLRLRRLALGLTQDRLADRLGCDRGHIDRLEEGRTRATANELVALSSFLGVPMVWFFDHPRPRSLTHIQPFNRRPEHGGAQVLVFPYSKAASGSRRP